MSKTSKAMVSYHRAATLSVACPVCHVPAGRHCPTPRKRPERETHMARVAAWEKQVAKFPTKKETPNG
jgi:hypothetical protein